MASITSIVWGGTTRNTSSNHLQHASWDPGVISCGGFFGGGVCNVPHACCDWYDYAWCYGVPGTMCVHPGVDVPMPYGTALYAARNGTVTYIGSDRGYAPLMISVKDPVTGSTDVYGHLSSGNGIYVGKVVSRGELIAWSGTGGCVPACPHLHFEILSSAGTFLDPVPVLTGNVVTPPPTGGYLVNDQIITTSTVNLRSTASTAGAIVRSLASGTLLCVIGGPVVANGYTWWQVNASGTTGWVAGSFTTMRTAQGCSTQTTPPPVTQPSSFAVNDKVYNTSTVNQRATASTTGTIVGSIPANADLCIVGGPTVAGGYTWYQVKYNNVTGWCIATYMKLRAAGGCTIAGNWPVGTTVKNVSGPTNIRSAAGTGASILGSIPLNATATVQSTTQTVANGYTWLNIKYGTITGWSVKSSFVVV
jgi:uncharacterized protein YraI